MTNSHAAGLRLKWDQRVDPLPCEHIFLEPAHTEKGHFITGLYFCIECGQALERPPTAMPPPDPTIPYGS